MNKFFLLLLCSLLVLSGCAWRGAVEPVAIPLTPTPPSTATAAPVAFLEAPTLVVPTATAPAPTVVPTPPPQIVAEADPLAQAQRSSMIRDQVALARQLGDCRETPDDCPTQVVRDPAEEQIGVQADFFVTSQIDNTTNTIVAELRYAGPQVLMYVEVGANYNQERLEASARRFEKEIVPRTIALFGPEFVPNVLGDARITVLNARTVDPGVLGYFAARDALPRTVNRFSNERAMFVMNIAALNMGSEEYLDVLAHEFQHMVHRELQPASATWFNEGASTLAQDLNGFVGQGYVLSYLMRTDTQLTTWTDQPARSIAHYGAAHLFLRYLYTQYLNDDDLPELIRADAGHNPEIIAAVAARSRPEIASFAELFADWAVANAVDDPSIEDGRFSYPTSAALPDLLPSTAIARSLDFGEHERDLAQFGVAYVTLPSEAGELLFEGVTTVGLTAAPARDSLLWWSGRGDNRVSTLTRAFDLREVTAATLTFDTWYEIEDDYDYAFVSVSLDNGETWQTLPALDSRATDPHGHNYGYGISGVSGATEGTRDGARGGWVAEQVDLSPFAGSEILLRFWMIHDEGFNAPGLMIDNLAIKELGFRDDRLSGPQGWDAAGFIRVRNELPQEWQVRLIRTAADGTRSVEPLAIDSAGRGQAMWESGETVVLVVAPTSPVTTERAQYRLVLR